MIHKARRAKTFIYRSFIHTYIADFHARQDIRQNEMKWNETIK